MRRVTWIEDLWQDLQYASRTLVRSPGFAAVAVLTLALGIGANTAIFSLINAVLMAPLPFHQPEQVVALWQTESAPGSYPLTGAIRLTLPSLDGSLALMGVRTMSQVVEESIIDTRNQSGLLGAMAGLALMLAAIGTYGVMSYVVGQRTNEIGIRMTLGAERKQIMAMVVRQAGIRVGAGIVLGWVGAAASTRWMRSLLVGVKSVDLATYGSVAALLAVVALTACYLPVCRAMRIDPMIALRDE
jgi:hypothetical protein